MGRVGVRWCGEGGGEVRLSGSGWEVEWVRGGMVWGGVREQRLSGSGRGEVVWGGGRGGEVEWVGVGG